MPRRLIKSFSFASHGVKHALLTQRNLLVHFIVGLGVIGLAFWLSVSLIELAILVLAVFAVIVTEMINTSIEELVNILSPDHRQAAALAKDVAAAAVLLAALGAIVVGIIVFLPRFI